MERRQTRYGGSFTDWVICREDTLGDIVIGFHAQEQITQHIRGAVYKPL